MRGFVGGAVDDAAEFGAEGDDGLVVVERYGWDQRDEALLCLTVQGFAQHGVV
jgi:hypothetical protein